MAAAELLFTGGIFYTMDPARPRAEAAAIGGGRILAVGSSGELSARYPEARRIPLGGRAVTPGLVDGHCHLAGLGGAMETVDLRGAPSEEAAAERVARAAREAPPGEWIFGRGWDQNLWPGRAFPRREALDRAAPENPVALRRIDGHALWASSLAIRAAALDPGAEDPPGGLIARGPDGAPTGLFVDTAMELIEARAPAPTAEVYRRRILKAARAALAAGLTGVHEMGIDDACISAYRALAAAGALPLRVYAFLEGRTRGVSQIDSLPSRRPDADPDGRARFVLRGVKLFADGALGSRGAALSAPYCDDPKNRGLSLLTDEELRRAVSVATRAGFQVAVHAIGDAANRQVLDAFEAEVAGRRELRLRIEHAQIVDPADLPRFERLGVLAAMQPSHATSDMPWAESRLGPERIRWAYAWRAMREAGVRVIGGSDFPIEEHPPLLGLHAAVTRTAPSGEPEGGWLPAQRLTLEEALSLYTVEPAYAAFAEAQRGRLAPGYVADLTVFDRELDPARLLEARVDATIVDGEIAYERAGAGLA